MIQRVVHVTRQVVGRPTARLLGAFALFSGVALLVNILWSVSLPLALAVTAAILVAASAAVWQRTSRPDRAWLIRRVAAGAGIGVVATLAYDVTKATLSQLDPSPYNPFDAVRVFGTLLLGGGAGEPLTSLVGTGFHFLNGVSFAVAFALLARGRFVVLGVGWGLFLETFQLTLYPGWLGIRLVQEFTQISAASHVIYGLVLGGLVGYADRRFR